MKVNDGLRLSGLLAALLFLAGCTTNERIIATSAMAPTLPQGSRFAIDTRAFRDQAPPRFALVIFKYTDAGRDPNIQAPEDGTEICYRVIGLPGESVEVTDAGVLIDGNPLQDLPGIRYEPAPPSEDFIRFNKIELSENGYYLLGDNSRRALDSRYWGEIQRDHILGRVTPRTNNPMGGNPGI